MLVELSQITHFHICRQTMDLNHLCLPRPPFVLQYSYQPMGLRRISTDVVRRPDGPYLNVGSTPTPEVASYSPSRGASGTKIFVYIRTLYELITTNSPAFFLMFGQRKCFRFYHQSELARVACASTRYRRGTRVRQHWLVFCPGAVFMFMESGDGDMIAKVDVGPFTYVDGRTADDGAPLRTLPEEEAIYRVGQSS